MKRARRKKARKVIRSWTRGRTLLERWRRNLTNVQVELKRPRVIDVVPIDFLRGEPVERQGTPKQKFRGRVIYFTSADVTLRRPSGAVLVIDNYEITALSDGSAQIEPG